MVERDTEATWEAGTLPAVFSWTHCQGGGKRKGRKGMRRDAEGSREAGPRPPSAALEGEGGRRPEAAGRRGQSKR